MFSLHGWGRDGGSSGMMPAFRRFYLYDERRGRESTDGRKNFRNPEPMRMNFQ
jgi:hypothetical protein